nr:BfmA/BtgA family mobilization protein [uncultured Mucilaginibacter sp.]
MTEDINVRSVRYPLITDQKFEKIALKLGRTKRQVFIQMVDYFYKSKKDPMDLNDDMLKNTLMKNHQQYIGFIKTQENMLLVPMKALLDRIGESQRQVIDRFNTEVLEHNVEVLSNQHEQAEVFLQIRELMEAIMKMQKSGEALKAQFMAILEGYISSRETFTLMTSGREKEELINAVKAQVRSL